jgi:hypothetical protein
VRVVRLRPPRIAPNRAAFLDYRIALNLEGNRRSREQACVNDALRVRILIANPWDAPLELFKVGAHSVIGLGLACEGFP